MATKPTENKDWCLTGTNVVASTAGHRADGYASNEIPSSAELNYFFKAHARWLAYLESTTDDLLTRYLAQSTNLIGPSKWLPTVASAATWAGGDWAGTAGNGFGLQATVDMVPVGGTIQSARFAYNRAGAGTVTRSLIRVPVTNPGGAVTVYTSTDTTTTGYQDFVATGINHVVLDGHAYSLVVSFNAASDAAGARLFAGGVTWI